MKQCIYLIVFFILRPQITEAQPYNFSDLDKILKENKRAIGGFSKGFSLTLIKDGKVIYNYENSNYSANRVVPVASASKWLSAGVIMALVDEGKLSLDDQVKKYLPEFTGDKGEATVRQLFSHTAGFAGRDVKIKTLNNRHQSFQDNVMEIAKIKMDSKPGSQFSYGGISMQIAGRMAEIASGKTWDQLFYEKIARPLGITQISYTASTSASNPRIAGGAKANASDYLKYLEMIFNKGMYRGKRVLTEKAVNSMLADQTNGVPIAFSPYTQYKALLNSTADARYGMGCWRQVTDNKDNLPEISSPGAFGFTPWIDYKNGYYAVISTRGTFKRVMPVYIQIRNSIEKALSKQNP